MIIFVCDGCECTVCYQTTPEGKRAQPSLGI
jgi:hypothetical protein